MRSINAGQYHNRGVMNCDLQYARPLPDGKHLLTCQTCGREIRTRRPDKAFKAACGKAGSAPQLTAEEQAALFPKTDPTLIGERIAAMTKALGIVPCGGCNKRREWLNRAHQWLRDQFGGR